MKTGITTSLNDEEIPEEAQERINEHLNNKMDEVDKLVEAYEEGYLEALPGRSLAETLEMRIMQVLGEARDMSGQIAEHYLNMGKQSLDDPYDHVMAVEKPLCSNGTYRCKGIHVEPYSDYCLCRTTSG
jgi:DNA-directed RNA polymerase, beta'' subunit/160 kD subunit